MSDFDPKRPNAQRSQQLPSSQTNCPNMTTVRRPLRVYLRRLQGRMISHATEASEQS